MIVLIIKILREYRKYYNIALIRRKPYVYVLIKIKTALENNTRVHYCAGKYFSMTLKLDQL